MNSKTTVREKVLFDYRCDRSREDALRDKEFFLTRSGTNGDLASYTVHVILSETVYFSGENYEWVEDPDIPNMIKARLCSFDLLHELLASIEVGFVIYFPKGKTMTI